jgi:hypothetical protein
MKILDFQACADEKRFFTEERYGKTINYELFLEIRN